MVAEILKEVIKNKVDDRPLSPCAINPELRILLRTIGWLVGWFGWLKILEQGSVGCFRCQSSWVERFCLVPFVAFDLAYRVVRRFLVG